MPDSIAPTSSSPKIARPLPLVPAAGKTGGTAGSRVNHRAVSRKPLPDARAIRTIAVPETAPPYDDALPMSGAPSTVSRLTGLPGGGGPATTGRALAAPKDAEQETHTAQRLLTSPWPGQFAQVLAETLAGSRPAEQIVPWTTQQARRRISQLGPLLATTHRPRIRRIIVTSPVGGVLEMAVIVGLGTHVRALAVRLERASQPADSPRVQAPATPGQLASGRAMRSGAPPGEARWYCTAVEAA